MPISIKDFNKGIEPPKEKGASVKPKIEKHLQADDTKAYTVKEIAEELELNKATVNNTVNNMYKKGVVDKRNVGGLNYFRWLGGEGTPVPEEGGESGDEYEGDDGYEEDPE